MSEEFKRWKQRQQEIADGILDPLEKADGDLWVEWSPRFAPHVKGKYTERTFDLDHRPEPQRFEAHCTHCGQKWGGPCMTGAVKSHIARFAAMHLHRDPMHAPRVVRPDSLRRTVLEGEETPNR